MVAEAEGFMSRMGLGLAAVLFGLAALAPGAPRARAQDAVAPEHVHFAGCGHFFYDGAWHDFPNGHVHGPGCGHFLANGLWSRFPAEHTHHPGCGHYYWNGMWSYFPSAHRHSPACGHFFYGGEWHPFAPGHVHGPGCGHSFYDGCWHPFPEGHVHGLGCGHAFVDGEWRERAPGEGAAPLATADGNPEFAYFPPVARPAPEVVDLVPPPIPRHETVPIDPPVEDRVITITGGGIVVAGGARGGHRHGFGCGHYYYQGRWNDLPPRAAIHVHGPGCGHYYWLQDHSYHRGPYPNAPVHIHGIGCGHYYWNGAYRVEPNPAYVRPRPATLRR
jgi:hypothetical protein